MRKTKTGILQLYRDERPETGNTGFAGAARNTGSGKDFKEFLTYAGYHSPSRPPAKTTGREEVQAENAQQAGDNPERARQAGDNSERIQKPGENSERARQAGDNSERIQKSGENPERARQAGENSERIQQPGENSERARQAGENSERIQKPGDNSERVSNEKEEDSQTADPAEENGDIRAVLDNLLRLQKQLETPAESAADGDKDGPAGTTPQSTEKVIELAKTETPGLREEMTEINGNDWTEFLESLVDLPEEELARWLEGMPPAELKNLQKIMAVIEGSVQDSSRTKLAGISALLKGLIQDGGQEPRERIPVRLQNRGPTDEGFKERVSVNRVNASDTGKADLIGADKTAAGSETGKAGANRTGETARNGANESRMTGAERLARGDTGKADLTGADRTAAGSETGKADLTGAERTAAGSETGKAGTIRAGEIARNEAGESRMTGAERMARGDTGKADLTGADKTATGGETGKAEANRAGGAARNGANESRMTGAERMARERRGDNSGIRNIPVTGKKGPPAGTGPERPGGLRDIQPTATRGAAVVLQNGLFTDAGNGEAGVFTDGAPLDESLATPMKEAGPGRVWEQLFRKREADGKTREIRTAAKGEVRIRTFSRGSQRTGRFPGITGDEEGIKGGRLAPGPIKDLPGRTIRTGKDEKGSHILDFNLPGKTLVEQSLKDPGSVEAKNRMIEKIGEQVKLNFRQGQRTIEMKLEPEHLGRLRVYLRVEGEGVVVKFRVDNPEARSFLEQNLQWLKNNLLKDGLNPELIQVESDLNNSNYDQQQYHGDSERQEMFYQQEQREQDGFDQQQRMVSDGVLSDPGQELTGEGPAVIKMSETNPPYRPLDLLA